MAFPAGAQPGIDVSHYQGAVDWPTVAEGGEVFAFAKASEGSGDQAADLCFADNWVGMKAADLLRGAYHFFHPGSDANAQADAFLASLSKTNGGSPVLNPGDLPPALDLEVTDSVSPADIISAATVWLQKVRDATGKQPLLYTFVSFWQNTLGNPTELADYPLWIADTQVSAPIVPGGWSNWYFWQFDQQTIGGIASPTVDVDAFNGTLHDLQSFAGLPAPLAQPRTVKPGKLPRTAERRD
jgi:lysozyme